MKRNRILLWITIGLLILNLAAMSFFWIRKPVRIGPRNEGRNNPEMRPQNFEHRMARHLNLDQAQIEEYHALMIDHMKKIDSIHESIKQKKWQIHQQLLSAEPDSNYINILVDSIGNLSATFEKLNYDHFIQLKGILNDNQLDNFKKLINGLPYHDDEHPHRHQGERRK